MYELKALRVKLGVSQAKLGDIMFISDATISEIENKSKRNPRIERHMYLELKEIEREMIKQQKLKLAALSDDDD